MSRRLLPLLAVAAAVAVAAAGCAGDPSAAATINGEVITHDALLDEVAERAGNDDDPRSVTLQAAPAEGAYPLDPVASILQDHIYLEISRQRFEELGLELTPDMRDEALTLLFGDPAAADAALGGFSEDYADWFVDAVARSIALRNEIGDDELIALLQRADVEVSSRYGAWDSANFVITPPTGPITAAFELEP